MKRTLISLALSIIFLCAGFFIRGATPVHAATQQHPETTICDAKNDSSCNGRYAVATLAPNGINNCSSDAYVVANRFVTISSGYGEVFLMYSSACKTNWSEAEYHGGLNGGHSVIANANVTRSDGLRYDGTFYVIPGQTFESPMVYSPVLTANACGSIDNIPGGCTGYL